VSARLNAIVSADAALRPPAPTSAGATERQRIFRAGYDIGGLVPIRTALTDRLQESSWVVFAAAACLVLLACLNVTGLMVTRLRDRWRELAVRRALGASARDLIRLLAAESTLIVGAGATLGIASAGLLLPLTTRFLTGFLLVLKPAVIDRRVAAYAALASLVCVLLTTLLSTRAATTASMRLAVADGGGTSPRERRGRLVLALEVALAFVVAVGGALVAGSLMRVWAEDPGFDMRHTGLISMSAPRGASATDIDQLIVDIQRMPGVAHAGGVGHALLERAFNGNAFDAPAGIGTVEQSGGPSASGRTLTLPIESIPVTRGYFAAAGLAPIDGRVATDDELSGGAAVLTVGDRVARAYWPDRRAVGQTLLNHGRPFTVVGVVPNARFMSLDTEPQGEIYWSVGAMPKPSISHVLVRLNPDASLGPVAASLVRGCPTCWVRQVRMLDDALGETISQRQFSAWLFSAFGIAALLTVGTGILGLVAMTTKRRTREIGIRIALGASRGNVLRQIVREQMQAVALGLVVGAVAAAWLTGFLTGYLYKTEVYDVWSWAAAIAALLIVALTGALIPSRQASRIDPMRALRVD
jgi:predicted permease